MRFDLSQLPPEFQKFVKDSLEARRGSLVNAEKEIKKALDESVSRITQNMSGKNFSGVTRELADIIENEKIEFASELERIVQESITRTAYAGLHIGESIKRFYKKSGLFSMYLIEKDIEREAELIAESTMQKKRVFNNREFVLSDRIWDLSGNNLDKIKDILNAGINTDSVEVAKALQGYIKKGAATFAKDYPNMYERMGGRVPKNLAYEALLLARNELSETYWDATVEGFRENPAIVAVKWLLSNNRLPGYHDICDTMAYTDYHGLGAGVYPIEHAPAKPHIACLCTLAPVTASRLEKGVANKVPENWEEIEARLEKTSAFINMKELSDEEKETLREQRREAYRKRKEKLDKEKKIDDNILTEKDLKKIENYLFSGTDPLVPEIPQRVAETHGKDLVTQIGKKEASSVYRYTQHFTCGTINFRDLNAYLRDLQEGTATRNETFDNFTKHLNYALGKCDNYRGVLYRVQSKWEGLGELKVNEEFPVPQFWSASKKQNEAKKFGGNYEMRIESKKGKDIKNCSMFPNEEEVLFKTNSKFKIIDIDFDGRKYRIDIEEV